MIRSLMALALRERIVVIGIALMLLLAGAFSFSQLDIEAYPDPVQPLIEVLTLPSGLSAEEVEKLVTVPTEYGLGGMRNLEAMRSISLYGLSDIRCYFSWDSDYYWDRIETINRLSFLNLPQGVTPGISPENPIGEIYRYTVESPDHDLTNEKTIEDWVLEKQIRTVPGVEDVSGFGGLTKQFQVEVDPHKLNYYQVPLSTLIAALQNSNTNSGGNYMSVGEQAFDVRGLGFFRGLDDIRNVVLNANKSTPIKVSNVAEVKIGYAPRLGIVGKDNQNEVVTGIVLMRKYGNTLATLKGVEAKVHELNTTGILPKGYKVVPYYDRTQLVETTLHTVIENLTIGMALVFLVLIFFLGNLRAAIIAAVNIPLALCGAFALMHATNTPANLISLGAIDFGIIIDTTVIVMENIERHLTASEHSQRELSTSNSGRRAGSWRPDVVLDDHFRDRIPAAVHDARGRGRHLLTDVAHLRVRAGHRDSVRGHVVAGAVFIFLREGDANSSQPHLVGNRSVLPWTVCPDPALAAVDVDRSCSAGGRRVVAVSAAGRSVSAQARGRKHLGARDDAADDLAGAWRQIVQSDAHRLQELPGGRLGCVAARPPRRRHRDHGFFQH